MATFIKKHFFQDPLSLPIANGAGLHSPAREENQLKQFEKKQYLFVTFLLFVASIIYHSLKT